MPYILIIILLSIIVYQDFSQRSIRIWIVPILLVLGVWIGLSVNNYQAFFQYFIGNILFILLQISILTTYFSIKERQVVNIIDRWLGLGDIVFFIGIALLFSPLNFITFFIGSILLVLVFFIISQVFLKNTNTIPLAGGMAIPLILVYLTIFFTKNKFIILYQDEYILQWLLNNTNIY